MFKNEAGGRPKIQQTATAVEAQRKYEYADEIREIRDNEKVRALRKEVFRLADTVGYDHLLDKNGFVLSATIDDKPGRVNRTNGNRMRGEILRREASVIAVGRDTLNADGQFGILFSAFLYLKLTGDKIKFQPKFWDLIEKRIGEQSKKQQADEYLMLCALRYLFHPDRILPPNVDWNERINGTPLERSKVHEIFSRLAFAARILQAHDPSIRVPDCRGMVSEEIKLLMRDAKTPIHLTRYLGLLYLALHKITLDNEGLHIEAGESREDVKIVPSKPVVRNI